MQHIKNKFKNYMFNVKHYCTFDNFFPLILLCSSTALAKAYIWLYKAYLYRTNRLKRKHSVMFSCILTKQPRAHLRKFITSLDKGADPVITSFTRPPSLSWILRKMSLSQKLFLLKMCLSIKKNSRVSVCVS